MTCFDPFFDPLFDPLFGVYTTTSRGPQFKRQYTGVFAPPGDIRTPTASGRNNRPLKQGVMTPLNPGSGDLGGAQIWGVSRSSALCYLLGRPRILGWTSDRGSVHRYMGLVSTERPFERRVPHTLTMCYVCGGPWDAIWEATLSRSCLPLPFDDGQDIDLMQTLPLGNTHTPSILTSTVGLCFSC